MLSSQSEEAFPHCLPTPPPRPGNINAVTKIRFLTSYYFKRTVCFADFMSNNNISEGVKEEKMKLKTMEALLMLDADTAASLQGKNHDPQQFLLLLGNIVRNITRGCPD